MKFRVQEMYKDGSVAREYVSEDASIIWVARTVRMNLPDDVDYFKLWNPTSNTLVYTGDRN